MNGKTVPHAGVIPGIVPGTHPAGRLFPVKHIERRHPVVTLVFAVEERTGLWLSPKMRPRRHILIEQRPGSTPGCPSPCQRVLREEVRVFATALPIGLTAHVDNPPVIAISGHHRRAEAEEIRMR